MTFFEESRGEGEKIKVKRVSPPPLMGQREVRHKRRGLQVDHGGQGLGFVDFALVVPFSAQFCLGL